ncbi:gastric triacylglycerol lipase-like [Bolinopsis microptera]|uniref:gastric triacylglycerol lipase-like n=1 Tax=Bolinopsis microptera TaxID=2820187 RepID=UPI003078F4A3
MLYLTILLLLPALASCKVDPELHMPTPEMIRYMGYQAEEHWVTTPDGYILGMHRIPAGKSGIRTSGPKPVVFLQHGLTDSSATWVMNMPNNSLGFMMADAGFDVWLGNVRGNTYSTNHTSLSPKDAKFWEFTFDEFAAIDLPTMVNFVLKQTGVKTISYFGHSQGTLIAFIEFSKNQELAAKINMYGAMAPVARITHIEGLIKGLNLIEPQLEKLLAVLGIHDFAPSNWFVRELAALLCPLEQAVVCRNIMFLLCGYDLSNLDEERVPIYIAHTPAGTSVRNMLHWAQLLRDGQLQRYDFGSPDENLKHYNSTTPPTYDITGLNIPTALIAGGNDFLADPRDVAWLEGQLNPKIIVENIFYDDYNHLDFVWGNDAYERVYKTAIALAKKYSGV